MTPFFLHCFEAVASKCHLRCLLLAAALVAIRPTPARAETVLTLDEALALARAHNRDLRAARAHLAQSAANVEQAWSALLPQVTAQGRYTHNYKNVALDLSRSNQGVTALADAVKGASTNPAEIAAIDQFEQRLSAAAAAQPPIVIQKGEQLDLDVRATVPLVVPQAYAALGAAKLTQRSNAAGFDVTEATVLLSVAQAYYAAAGADELVGARHHAVSVATDTYDNAKSRVEAGVVNRVEMARAEVALVRAKQNELEAENTRAAAYRSLATLLGTRDSLKVKPKEAVTPSSPPSPPVQKLVTRAAERRPEFAMYETAIDAAAATARSNALRWAPTLSAFGNAKAFNYAGFAGDQYSWAAGLQLDWTLYDGGTRDAQRHLAIAQERETEARLDLLRDTVTDEIVDAESTLQTKRRAVDAADRAQDLSRETLRLIRAQYDAGTAQQLDVLQAQDSLVVAEVAVAQAHFDLALADLRLKRAAGTFPSERNAQ